MSRIVTDPRLSKVPERQMLSPLARRVLAGTLVLAGLHVLVASPHFVIRIVRGSPTAAFVGIDNFARVDESLWRGAAPTADGYSALADAGATTVIDLRAEADPIKVEQIANKAGLAWVHVPIRDGQSPTLNQVSVIADTIAADDGPVFVHCQAGVGRTGSVIAAVQVAAGQTPGGALVEALRFGPISLEQQVFILQAGPDQATASPLSVVAASRVIDSPRRLWSRLTG